MAPRKATIYNADFTGKMYFMVIHVGNVGLDVMIVPEGGFTSSKGLHMPKDWLLASSIRAIETDQM